MTTPIHTGFCFVAHDRECSCTCAWLSNESLHSPSWVKWDNDYAFQQQAAKLALHLGLGRA